ncbi:uncharacterized protein LOC116221865 [Clupea harengus]|uniref:Uncharacterized protein LOC116221865 n=1 Tax=Clupea harengus TaxID=7950 RepID=A0A8M1KPP2_CLUHA|nr:uncharacterized protein LOC116221865 [Clupea harengus]
MSMAVLTLISLVLVQPNISLSAPNGGLFWGPQGPEVTRGHSLSIICSTGPQYQGGSFHLIFDGSNTTRTELAVNHSASFYIPEADYSHQGNYSCVYEVNVSRRAFKSTHTALLTIIIRLVLVQPNISLSAPNGGLFWGPQGPEVTRGHSFSIICSTGPQYQGGSFHLIFDGSKMTRTELAVNHSASFYIPEADYSHQGNYSCVYEVNVSGRAFKSTRTALLTIIIRPLLVPIIASGVISVFFLLLLITAIFCLGNLGEDANSDVEEDYVNVPNMRNGSAAIENGYEEDCIYQNYK